MSKYTAEQVAAIEYMNEVDAHMGDQKYWQDRADGEGYSEEDAAYWGLPRWEACEASHSDNALDTLRENGLTLEDAVNYRYSEGVRQEVAS